MDIFKDDPRLRLRPAQAESPCSSATGGRPGVSEQCRRRRLIASDVGATGIEYALLACFIALAITIGTSLAGNGLNKMFYVIGNKMMTATNAAVQNSN